MAEHQEEELLDYEEDEVEAGADAGAKADGQKKGYVGIHSTSFKDFLLKVRLGGGQAATQGPGGSGRPAQELPRPA
jgi:hypothetical protein